MTRLICGLPQTLLHLAKRISITRFLIMTFGILRRTCSLLPHAISPCHPPLCSHSLAKMNDGVYAQNCFFCFFCLAPLIWRRSHLNSREQMRLKKKKNLKRGCRVTAVRQWLDDEHSSSQVDRASRAWGGQTLFCCSCRWIPPTIIHVHLFHSVWQRCCNCCFLGTKFRRCLLVWTHFTEKNVTRVLFWFSCYESEFSKFWPTLSCLCAALNEVKITAKNG